MTDKHQPAIHGFTIRELLPVATVTALLSIKG